MAGGEEVLADTSPGSPNIDQAEVKKSGAPITIVPHMFGLPEDLSGLDDLAVVEDCAQALGAKVMGAYAGLQGRAGVFSFAATKLMTSGGQGGMIVSRDRALTDAIRDYREFDCRRDSKIRFNFQMTDLQAAVGRVQLTKLPGFLSRREEIFQMYREAGLDLLGADIDPAAGLEPVRYRAVRLTPEPAGVIESLADQGVKAIIPVEDWELLGPGESYPNALKLTKTTVSLPSYPSLTEGEARAVIEALG